MQPHACWCATSHAHPHHGGGRGKRILKLDFFFPSTALASFGLWPACHLVRHRPHTHAPAGMPPAKRLAAPDQTKCSPLHPFESWSAPPPSTPESHMTHGTRSWDQVMNQGLVPTQPSHAPAWQTGTARPTGLRHPPQLQPWSVVNNHILSLFPPHALTHLHGRQVL